MALVDRPFGAARLCCSGSEALKAPTLSEFDVPSDYEKVASDTNNKIY